MNKTKILIVPLVSSNLFFFIELEDQTTQWPKEKGQKDKQPSTKKYTYN
jgi:hypothetical protein